MNVFLIIAGAILVLFIFIPFYVAFISSIQMRAWIQTYVKIIKKSKLKTKENGEKKTK